MQAANQPRSHARRSSIVKWLVTTLPLGLLIVYLAVGGVAANALTVPKRQFDPQNTPGRFNLPFEEIQFPARGDGVQIAGWYIPRQGSSRALLVVHGKDASRTIELAGSLVDLGAMLQKGGYNLLMIDLRGHGQSADGRYSFGLNERRDVEGAVDWLLKRGFAPSRIGVLGISLGAASAIGATAEEPRIAALATDSAFAEFCPILQKQWHIQTGLPDLLEPSALLMTRMLFGIDLCASRPVQEVSRIAPRPLLLMHSTSDELVPVVNFQRLSAAAPSAETWVVSGPEHARIFNAYPEEYTGQVIRFFDASLGASVLE